MIQSNQAIIILLYNITFVGLYKGYHIYRALQCKIYLIYIAEENYGEKNLTKNYLVIMVIPLISLVSSHVFWQSWKFMHQILPNYILRLSTFRVKRNSPALYTQFSS